MNLQIGNANTILFNGNDVQRVVYNGVEVWRKGSTPTHDYSLDYFTIIPSETGSILWKAKNSSIAKTIEYSENNGAWTSITSTTDGVSIPMTSGKEYRFRGTNTALATSSSTYSYFDITISASVCGNIMSLLNGDNFYGSTLTTSNNFAFCSLFKPTDTTTGSKITSSKNLVLPIGSASSCFRAMFSKARIMTETVSQIIISSGVAYQCYYMFEDCKLLTTPPALPSTAIGQYCYAYMFTGCASLTAAPTTLPATTLQNYCYTYMFNGCTSLTTAPTTLPATTLAQQCYTSMFRGCSSLTTAPSFNATTLASNCCQSMFQNCTALVNVPTTLPATTLIVGCYYAMFRGCSSLTTAPELPATKLANNCYQQMFYECTSLITAPHLPALTLNNNCYREMFYGCSNLSFIKAMFTTPPSTAYTNNWVNGVSSTGIFGKNGKAQWEVYGNYGIPQNWTIRWIYE